MKTRVVLAMAAMLLGAGTLPMAALASSPGSIAMSPSSVGVAPSASECSPAVISELSAAVDSAHGAWAQRLSPDSYASFNAARDLYVQRRDTCANDGASYASVAGGTDAIRPSSTSDAPLYVPDSGIAIDIRSTSNEVIAGLPVVYVVTVTTGSGDAADSTGVSVTLILPVAAGGPQYLDSTGGCTFATPTLSCALGTIARHGGSRSFLVRLSTPPDLYFDGTTSLVTLAVVTRTEADAVSADNSDLSSTLVTEQADLRIYKYMMPTSPIVGEIAQYTIYVENYGPSTARDALVRDTLLAGPADALDAPMTIQSCAFSVSQGGGAITQFTCTTGPVVGTQFGTDAGTFATNRLDPLDFNVPPGPDVQGRLRGAFRLVFNRELTQVNTATTESPTPDPDWSNNHAETITEVHGASNVSIDKTGPTEAGIGEVITYSLTVTNTGTGFADNVVASDFLPAELGNVVVTSSQGSCSVGVPGDPTRPLACNLGQIAATETATVTVAARVMAMPAGGTLFNDAQVASSPADAASVDNVDTVSTTIHQTCGVQPLVPTLLSPNGGVSASRRVLFDWADTSCATRYVIKVYKGSPASAPIRWVSLNPSEIVFRLPLGKTIYWKVRACNKIGCSAFSAPFSFMTPP
jgi:uncharacterized repeat protein (TIGR01451 family)